MPPSSLIGRETELLALERALDGPTLLTITGVGGCGKSRLARELVRRVGRGDGALESVFVELGSVQRDDRVVDAVLRALRIRERGGRTGTEVLVAGLAGRRLLLVLDNCEHLVPEVSRVADDVLDQAPGVHLVATSRAPLGIDREVVFSLPLLTLPEAEGDISALVRSESGRLFVERAAAVDPGFELTRANVQAVVRICRELDGLPLAIGLAAGQVAHLGATEIAGALTERGRLAPTSDNGALPQHRSLRASLDWSYDLLEGAERVLFRRLSVFSGSWTAASAHAIALPEASAAEANALLRRLHALGLIVSHGQLETPSWAFLETVAAYAAERLAAHDGEYAATADRHLRWFHDFALEIDALLPEPGGRELIERETANLRRALERALDRDQRSALQMVGALLRHWILAEHFDEGRSATAAALSAAPADGPAGPRASVHLGAALLGVLSEDYPLAAENLQSGMALLAGVRDAATQARCLQMASMVLILTGMDLEAGLTTAQRALELARRVEDPLLFGWALVNVAMAAVLNDRLELWRAPYDEFLRIPRVAEQPKLRMWAELAAAWAELTVGSPKRAVSHTELALTLEGDWPSMTHFILTGFKVQAMALLGRASQARAGGGDALSRAQESGTLMAAPGLEMALAVAAYMDGDLDEAEGRARPLLAMPQTHTVASIRELLGQIALARRDAAEAETQADELEQLAAQTGSTRHRAAADFLHGVAAAIDGDAGRSLMLLHASLAANAELGNERGVVDALEELALIAAEADRNARAARLVGAAAAARERLSVHPAAASLARLAVMRAAGIERDGPDAWESASREGERLTLPEAITYARQSRGRRRRPAAGWPSLTPKELDVARLAATGLSNPQIAAQLFISRGTVKMHLSNVYTKIGVANRTELAASFAANGR